jgi:molecular chaperone GrpE
MHDTDTTLTPDANAAHAAAENGHAEAATIPDGEPDLRAILDALAARVNELEAETGAARDQVLRAMAEADNVRKRADRQLAEEKQYAIERFARDLLGVADNMTRALAALDGPAREGLGDAGRTLAEGVEMTARELSQAMTRHGVRPIEAGPGSAFDPHRHQAVAQIPSAQPAGTIAELFQGGYELNGRVLRAAMVAVSAGGG